MSNLSEFAAVALKVATEIATKGQVAINDEAICKAAIVIGETADKVAEKAGLLRENRYGELKLKLPFFKNTEDKIEEAFATHPERNKFCFHFLDSIREGVDFYDPEGNKVFEIRKNKKNLRHFDLYAGDRFVGRISKHVTINLNPFADVQKYDVSVRNTTGVIKVNWFNASTDITPWVLKHKRGGNYIIEDGEKQEIGRVYSLGFFNFVMDYIPTVDPVLLLLEFMAIKIRFEEVKRNHEFDKKGLWIDHLIADVKDVF